MAKGKKKPKSEKVSETGETVGSQTETYELDPQRQASSINLARASRQDTAAAVFMSQWIGLFGDFILTVNPNQIWRSLVLQHLQEDAIAARTIVALEEGADDPIAEAFTGVESDQRFTDTSDIHANPPMLTAWGIDGHQGLRYFEGFLRELMPRVIQVSLRAALRLSHRSSTQLLTDGAVRRGFADSRAPLPPLPPDDRAQLLEWITADVAKIFTPNPTGEKKTQKNADRLRRYEELCVAVAANPADFERFAPTLRNGLPKPVRENVETTARKKLLDELVADGDNISDAGLQASLKRARRER